MIKIKLASLFFFICILCSCSFSQQAGDRIIAVVGNDVILESDFQYQLQLYARQNQLSNVNPALAQEVFQQMLIDKIILAKAEQDTITVSEDEVSKELEFRIKNLTEQMGSQQKVEEVYGMSLGQIKVFLKEDLRKNLKAEKLKRKQFPGGVKVTDREVRNFYKTYGDSLPMATEQLELSHIFLYRSISETERSIARQKAQQILDSLKSGRDFSELAKRNSEDSLSAIAGGDLGFAKKGSFVKNFEDALFTLKPGEVSGLVETEFGYHIIKLNEKRGDLVSSKHILIKYPKLESSDFSTISALNDIRSKIISGQMSFEEAAKKYSQDEKTRESGGKLGLADSRQLDSATYSVLKNTPLGGITTPLRSGSSDNLYGYQIFKVNNKIAEHRMTLETDYDRIKLFAANYKENKDLEAWINKLRETIYVDVRI